MQYTSHRPFLNNVFKIVYLLGGFFMENDRRVRKTKAAIKSAFIQLLTEKELEKITIQDITQRADINRGTFYLHYEDKYLLLSSLEDEYTFDLTNEVKLDQYINNNLPPEVFAKVFTEQILLKVVNYIYNHIEFYKAIFNLDRKSQLEEKIANIMYGNMQKFSSIDNKIADVPIDYFFSYTSGAMFAFIKHWVKDDNRMPPTELVNHLFKIIFNGPLRLMAKEQKIVE